MIFIKRLAIFFPLFFSIHICAQGPFSISGEINNMNGRKIFLVFYLGENRVADSSIVSNNKFKFSGTLKVPTRASLSFRDRKTNERQETSIFLESAFMKVVLNSDNIRDRQVSGSKSHVLERKLENSLYAIYGKYNDEYLQTESQHDSNKTSPLFKNKIARLDSLRNLGSSKIPDIIKRFILDNSNTYVSAYTVYFYRNFWKTDTISKYFNALTPKMRNSYYGLEIREYLSRRVKIGEPAKGFSILDVNNKQLALSEFLGKKYVLLDFWASWCIPCIAEFPELKGFYAENQENVEIIGLSIDEDTIAWQNALIKHKLPWRQVIIGNQTKKDQANILNIYIGVSTIPRQFLINKQGVVVGIFNSAPLDMDKLKKLLK